MPRKTVTETLAFTYHGEAADGAMDADDFALALLGYSKAIRAAVTTVSRNYQVPSIRFQRVERGSFHAIVTLATDATLWETLKTVFMSDDTQTIITIGTIGAGVGELIRQTALTVKKLAGRHATRERVNEQTDRITTSDGETFTVPMLVADLAMNDDYRDGMVAVIRPTQTGGVDSVSLDAAGLEPVVLEDRDIHAFHRVDDIAAEVTCESCVLDIERVAFDGGKWRFTRVYSDGRAPESFNATIRDRSFLNAVSRSQGFRKGDRLAVDLEVVIPRQAGKWRTFSVLRVREVLSAPTLPGMDEV